MNTYRVGDRVRFIHRIDHFGTVASRVYHSPQSGGPRQLVKWDNLDETAWDPCFLRPEESNADDDPEVVRSGYHVSRKNTKFTTNTRGECIILFPGLSIIKQKKYKLIGE